MADEQQGNPPAQQQGAEVEPITFDTLTQEQFDQLSKNAEAYGNQKTRAETAETEAKGYRQFLEAAGLDPKTGKPKEAPAPKKNGEGDDERFTKLQGELSQATERAVRAELRSIGVTHPDDLKIVMEAAKQLGIDPLEAAERPYVKAELEAQREVRGTKEATPAPRRSGGAQRNSKEPDFSKMSDKEFDEWERKNR